MPDDPTSAGDGPAPGSGQGAGRGPANPWSATDPVTDRPFDESEEKDFDAELEDDELIARELAEAEQAGDDPVALALAERDEYLDALRRLQADFENYRKRVTGQQADQVARAALSLVEKLLPVLDTLDLAAQHLGDPDSADAKALVASSGLLRDVLAKEGLERVDPLGEVFDPTTHEAVGQLPDEDEGTETTDDGPVHPAGTQVVGQVMRAGYRWKGVVVRPAMVMVRG